MYKPFEFFSGMFLPLKALLLILRTPLLLGCAVIPILIAILVSSAMVGFGYQEITALVQPWLEFLSAKIGIHTLAITINWIAKIVFAIVLFFSALFLFAFVANISGLPFNEYLSKKTEIYILDVPLQKTHFSLIHEIELLLLDLVKNLLALFLFIVLLFVALIPIANLFVLPLTWLLLTYQYLSYPQTRRGMGIKQSLAYVREHLFICLGFGLTLSAGFAVPFLNLLLTPIGVVGATMLHAQLITKEQ